jgi:hypothetical protein
VAHKLPNGLTIRQDNFARAIAAKVRPYDAAIEAGYSPGCAGQMASRLIKMPEVQAAIQAIREPALKQIEEQLKIDAAWVYDGIQQIRREGLKTLPVFDKAGDTIGYKPVDLGAAARATEMAAKLLGMMIDRQSIELSGEAKRVLEEVIQAVVVEVEDPAVRERILAKLAGEGLEGVAKPN